MQIDLLLQIAGVGLMTVVVSQVLHRAGREELSTLATIAGLVIVLMMVVTLVSDLMTRVKAMFLLA